jgi:hypothetical protein
MTHSLMTHCRARLLCLLAPILADSKHGHYFITMLILLLPHHILMKLLLCNMPKILSHELNIVLTS